MPYSDEDIKKKIEANKQMEEEKAKNKREAKRESLPFEQFILAQLQAIKNEKNPWLSCRESMERCMNTLEYARNFQNNTAEYVKALSNALEFLEREGKIKKQSDGQELYYSAI